MITSTINARGQVCNSKKNNNTEWRISKHYIISLRFNNKRRSLHNNVVAVVVEFEYAPNETTQQLTVRMVFDLVIGFSLERREK